MGPTTTLDDVVGASADGYPREITKCNVIRHLSAWPLQRPAFRVLWETPFQVDTKCCLVPDVSVISSNRIVPGSRGLLQGVSEFAITIVSSELATSLQSKIQLYFSTGGKSYWVLFSSERSIWIDHASGQGSRLGEDQPPTDPVLPGFSIPTSAIFEGV